MKYSIALVALMSVLSVNSLKVGADDCNATLLNCLSSDFTWCSYIGSSVWDTMFASDSEVLSSGDSDSPTCSSTGSLSECYVVGDEASLDLDCVTYELDGDVGCNEYACVDVDNTGTLTWHSGDSEYCCLDPGAGDSCTAGSHCD